MDKKLPLTLPVMLQLDTLLRMEYPADTTLGQIRAIFTASPVGTDLTAALQSSMTRPLGRLRIRFVDAALRDMPDAMPLEIFRGLVYMNMAKIIIEEGDGGARVSSPEPELVG